MKNKTILYQEDVELLRGDPTSIQIVYNKLTDPNVTNEYIELIQAMADVSPIIPAKLRISPKPQTTGTHL